MSHFRKSPQPVAQTLKVLAHLIAYPDDPLRKHLAELSQALHEEGALGKSRLSELDALINRLASRPALSGEADYVELFDRGRGTSLHLFEHVHGDSRDRGPAMIDLVRTYEEAGLLIEEGEMPDHLSVVLQYASTQPPAQAREFLGEISAIVRAIFSALIRRESPYASVLASLLDLAGEKAQPVTIPEEPDLDELWEEPVVFDGCSVKGQSQPVHFVRQPVPADITVNSSDTTGQARRQSGGRS